ncbi:MAG: VCBS repeat-containing protein [Planctomycetes bacterium]|nr:VCBS repeat-containing protein [Planctomycetota bacterium]
MRTLKLRASCLLLGAAFAAGPGGGLLAADCNSNGVEDAEDLKAGTSRDCNSNDVPDECDVRVERPSLEWPRAFPATSDPREPILVDMDGDGRPEVVCPDAAARGVAVHANRGGLLEAPLLVPLAVPPLAAAAGDLDSDGDPDIAAAGGSTAGRVVLLLQGPAGPSRRGRSWTSRSTSPRPSPRRTRTSTGTWTSWSVPRSFAARARRATSPSSGIRGTGPSSGRDPWPSESARRCRSYRPGTSTGTRTRT